MSFSLEQMLKAAEYFRLGREESAFLLLLGGDSPLLARNHADWRIRAIAALQQEGPHDLHFSGAVTLSKDDACRLQALLVKYIEEFQRQVIPSKDEAVAAICLDFYEL